MPNMPSKTRIAIIQQPPIFLNLAASLDLATALIAEAAAQHATLVVFPETWLTGYPVWLDFAPGAALWGNPAAEALFAHLYEHSPTIDGAEIASLASSAKEHSIDVVMGLHERSGNSLFNSMMMLGADGELGIHRKLMPTHGERLIWGQGDGSTLAAWQRSYGALGGLICWEHWMPLARAAMHAQHEIIHVAQWPEVHERHQVASRHYAFEGQCFVIAAGCVLTQQDVLDGFDSAQGPAIARELLATIPDNGAPLKNGGSAIIAPDMTYVMEPVFGEARTLFADIDLTVANAGKLYLDTHGHYARPDIFDLRIDTRTKPGVSFTEC